MVITVGNAASCRRLLQVRQIAALAAPSPGAIKIGGLHMTSRTTTAGAWYLDVRPDAIAAWMVRLRWARAAVDLLVLCASLLLTPADFPLRRLLPLVAAAGLVNADMARQLSSGRTPQTWLRAGALAIDV